MIYLLYILGASMKIDIQKRYSFEYYDDLIAFMIDNNYDLDHGDLNPQAPLKITIK